MSMKIDAEKLIVLVEQRPPIYDYTLKGHHNKDLIEQLWEEVANEIGSVSSADCKAKWNILRSSYARYIRELKKLSDLPVNSAAQKKKKWYMADCMSFLENFIGQHRQSKSNVLHYPVDDIDFEFKEEEICEDDTMLPDTASNDTSDRPISPVLQTSGVHVTRKKRKMTTSEITADTMISFSEPGSELHPLQSIGANMKFLESLLPDMEKLSSRRQRKFKLKVHSLLDSYLDEQENEQAAVTSASSNIVSPASSHSFYNT